MIWTHQIANHLTLRRFNYGLYILCMSACILLCVDPVPPPTYILTLDNTFTQLKSLTNKKRMQKTEPHISPGKNASLNITLRKSNQSLRNLKCGWCPMRCQLQTFQYHSHPGATASWNQHQWLPVNAKCYFCCGIVKQHKLYIVYSLGMYCSSVT